MGEIAVRFVLGGVVVSAFAALGEIFSPKTFGGIFAAAPSVALATLSLAFAVDGASYAAVECRSMLLGSVALLVYTVACAAMIARPGMPVWLGAGLSWISWFGTSFCLCWILQI